MLKRFILILLTVSVFLVFIENKLSLAVSVDENNAKEIYAKEIINKIESTEFTKKVLQELRVKGYSPESGVGYLINSPDNQVITIYLKNYKELDEVNEKEIQEIVNDISQKNNINLFSVDLQIRKN